MKIALIGDIHANIAALRSVLNHAHFQNVDMFINTGDYTGYGPFPDKTVQLMRRVEIVSVIGNYDQKVLSVPERMSSSKKAKMAAPTRTELSLATGSSLSSSGGFLSAPPFEELPEPLPQARGLNKDSKTTIFNGMFLSMIYP